MGADLDIFLGIECDGDAGLIAMGEGISPGEKTPHSSCFTRETGDVFVNSLPLLPLGEYRWARLLEYPIPQKQRVEGEATGEACRGRGGTEA